MIEAREHLDEALGHLDAKRPRSAKRRVELARASIGRALEAHPDYTDPTAAQGAQVSDGYEDRAVTAEDIRQREQRAAVDYCYEARMRAEGVRR